jgi:hypothetical protein
MAMHVHCKCLFKMFYLFFSPKLDVVYIFHTYVASFYSDVAYACNDFQVFLSV